MEQQRALLQNAPSDYDLLSIYRVMAEEMRHGWQMSYLLVTHFGDEGKREAEKLLSRRADEHERLLGSFNESVENWLDFFAYTEFIDRDGKYQLQMMSTSAFAPLARSMKPMLKEESFHLGTGNNGLLRIIKAGRIPTDDHAALLQQVGLDGVRPLRHRPLELGAVGVHVGAQGPLRRADESAAGASAAHLNEAARELYRQEVQGLIDRLNMYVPEEHPRLMIPERQVQSPDRRVQRDDLHGGLASRWTARTYEAYVAKQLPTAADRELLRDIFKENDWIQPKKSDD